MSTGAITPLLKVNCDFSDKIQNQTAILLDSVIQPVFKIINRRYYCGSICFLTGHDRPHFLSNNSLNKRKMTIPFLQLDTIKIANVQKCINYRS